MSLLIILIKELLFAVIQYTHTGECGESCGLYIYSLCSLICGLFLNILWVVGIFASNYIIEWKFFNLVTGSLLCVCVCNEFAGEYFPIPCDWFYTTFSRNEWNSLLCQCRSKLSTDFSYKMMHQSLVYYSRCWHNYNVYFDHIRFAIHVKLQFLDCLNITLLYMFFPFEIDIYVCLWYTCAFQMLIRVCIFFDDPLYSYTKIVVKKYIIKSRAI